MDLTPDPDGPSEYERWMDRRYRGHVEQSKRYGKRPLPRYQFVQRIQKKLARQHEKGLVHTEYTNRVHEDHGTLSATAINASTMEADDVVRHVLDKIVRQEEGSRFRGKTWTTIGAGCYRKNKLSP